MVRRQTEAIVHFDMEGKATPLRVRFSDEQEELQVIKKIKIINRSMKRVLPSMNTPAAIEYTYKCEVPIDDIKKTLTIVYNNQSCKWHMFI